VEFLVELEVKVPIGTAKSQIEQRGKAEAADCARVLRPAVIDVIKSRSVLEGSRQG
jgi:hypothetical protein